MAFKEFDCSSSDVVSKCSQLGDSVATFQPYPNERKIGLALSVHLDIPLNLTLQGGSCNISCEGIYRQNCNTSKEHKYWQNVTSPFYFFNCTLLRNYCIIAKIGDCCSICTETIFLEAHPSAAYSVDVSPWALIFTLLISIGVIVGVVFVMIKLYCTGSKKTWYRYVAGNKRDGLSLQHNVCGSEITVVLFYIRNENQLTLNNVTSLQTFLESRGFNVIDIYNEENEVNLSAHGWVQSVVRGHNTKVIFVDTDALRVLLDPDNDTCRTMTPVEQAILYSYQCLRSSNQHGHLFVVRFKGNEFDQQRNLSSGNGVSYLYQTNNERLVQDLQRPWSR